MKIILSIILLPFLLMVISELRWAYINNPNGKFTNIKEYFDYNRLPSRIEKTNINNETFIIAYSPIDTWLALPSGSAAYIFNSKGNLIEWTRDIGEDQNFEDKWRNIPKEKVTLEQFQKGF